MVLVNDEVVEARVELRISIEVPEELEDKLAEQSKMQHSPKRLKGRLKRMTLREGRRVAHGSPCGVVLGKQPGNATRREVNAASNVEPDRVIEFPLVDDVTADICLGGVLSQLPETVRVECPRLRRLMTPEILVSNRTGELACGQPGERDRQHALGVFASPD